MSKSKCQSLNSLLTVNSVIYNFYFSGFTFRSANKIYEDDAVVHLVLPPTPATCVQGSFVPFAILHRVLPPPLWPISGEGEVGPSHGHLFGWSGKRGETSVTPPHAGWPRMQKILVFVTLIPHMQNGQGQNHPCFFVTFFIMSKS